MCSYPVLHDTLCLSFQGPSDDYENFTRHSSDLDSVYQNYQPDATGKDDDYVDDDIYQNV